MGERKNSAEGAGTVGEVRAEAGPAHPLAVWLGWGLLRGSRVSRRFIATRKQRRLLKRAGATWFTVTADDGVKLAACRIPPTPAPGSAPGSAPAPGSIPPVAEILPGAGAGAESDETPLPIVFVPGWLEVKELHAPLALRWAGLGHEVVLMDLRAHGKSGGKVCTFSDLELADLDRVLAGAVERGWLGRRVLTAGVSTGAATALIHAAKSSARDMDGAVKTTDDPAIPAVAGVLALAPFIDLAEAVVFFRRLAAPRRAQPWLMRGVREAALREGFNLDAIDVEAAVRELTLPVLFVAGEADGRASMADQVKRLARAKSAGWSRYEEVPDANHFTLAQEAWPRVAEAFAALCRAARGDRRS